MPRRAIENTYLLSEIELPLKEEAIANITIRHGKTKRLSTIILIAYKMLTIYK